MGNVRFIGFLLIALFVFNVRCSTPDKPKRIAQFEHDDVTGASLYPTLDEIYSALNEAQAQAPHSVAIFELGKSALLNKTIPLIRLGDCEEDAKTRYLIIAGTHGDEAAPVTAMMYFVKRLITEKQQEKLQANKIAVDIVPVHNPDGYLENERENGKGIDLNRNFPFGNVKIEAEPENQALMQLVNLNRYKASVFLHSANEKMYENLIRVPIEFNQLGNEALKPKPVLELNKLVETIQQEGNQQNPREPWHSSSGMVDVSGTASDWCMSGFVKDSFLPKETQLCKKSHSSVSLEICVPKQPMDEARVESENKELYQLLLRTVFELNKVEDYEHQ